MDELTAERFGAGVPWRERTARPTPPPDELKRRYGLALLRLGDGGPDTRAAVALRRAVLLNDGRR